MAMRIGITMRIVNNAGYPEERDALSKDWSEYIRSVLPAAVLIPLLNRDDYTVKIMRDLKIDGVILSNGNSWGEARARDETERQVVDYCLKHKLPLLGVCRGFQVLNILFGGRIEKDIRSVKGENHVCVVHAADIVKGPPFRKWSNGKGLKVNSFHNQGVTAEGISPKFEVFAETKRGVVEGFFHRTKPIIGIQWHPERKNPSGMFDRQLITGLFNKGIFV